MKARRSTGFICRFHRKSSMVTPLVAFITANNGANLFAFADNGWTGGKGRINH